MDRSGLIDKLKEYGADVGGIRERFTGDARGYRACLGELLGGSHFDDLARLIEKGEALEAFELARRLMSMCSTAGVTPLYESVCVLVEILRPGEAENPSLDAAALKNAREQMATVLSRRDELRAVVASAPEEYDPPPVPKRKLRPPITVAGRVTLIIAAVVLVAGLGGGLLFSSITGGYEKNVETESATHLNEIGNQIALCVEHIFDSDWKAVHSVANAITQSRDSLFDDDLLAYMSREKDIWGVSDVMFYNAAGFGITSQGERLSNDAASDAAYYAKRNGEYMTVVRSNVTYVIPVETETTIGGSKIVAAGVVRNIGSFVDEMGISSFGGSAGVYLTEGNGVVMSRLTSNTVDTFNITTFLDETRLYEIGGQSAFLGELLSSDETKAYILKSASGNMYAVSAPVHTRERELRLFYVAPENAVNANMNSFSQNITHLSISIIALIAALSVLTFALVYGERKKQFTSVLSKRERTFDLLVENSLTAFALFTPDNPAEQFISANAEKIVGGERLVVEKSENGYRMTGLNGEKTPVSDAVNERMREWDGKSEFHSGYIPKGGRVGRGYFEIVLYPLEHNGGEFVGIAQDVSRKHDREEAVRVALEMARRSDEAKTRFLSNMSHDIRTPMNAIINMTDFAIDTAGEPDKQMEYLHIIRDSGDHLLSLINDILDVSRIESGQSVVGSEPFDIRSEVFKAAEMIRQLAAAKSQTLKTDFSRAYTRFVLGDKLKLDQILLNVMGNAVKFTPEGGEISLTVAELQSLGKNLASFRFVIADNGVGISQENLPKIFDPFMRADDRHVTSQEGTGLGLSICRSFVSAMGGRIKCESEIGKGSVFTIELTFEKAEKAEKPQIDPERKEIRQFTGRRCLVFEDNRTNQIIARTILEKCGFEVDVVDDGKIGVEKFVSSKADRYDIIYMDIRMPGMDGYEAADKIRRSLHPRAATVPIIAMTANVFAEDVEKSRLSGMNGHLGKPIVVSQLIEVTASAIQEQEEHMI